MTEYISKDAKVFIAGHRGMVGSAIHKSMSDAGYKNILIKTHQELDLLDQEKVSAFFEKEKPQAVIDAAAKVGGIIANNTYRADFLYQNIQIQNNLIWAAHRSKAESFIFLGSSCIYPKECPQPIQEEALLTGPLEETNRPYALAKIAGIELIDSLNKQYKRQYLSLMPCNLYGPNDNYDAQNSHVIPGLIRKFFEAEKNNLKSVTIWGSGTPLREFLHSTDLAQAVLKVCELPADKIQQMFLGAGTRAFLNVGSNREVSIKELAKILAEIFNFKGEIVFDKSKPDGTLRKILDTSKFLASGWKATTSLKAGLEAVVKELREKKSFT